MPENRNILKDLSVTLLYPGILGYFFVETFRLLNDENFSKQLACDFHCAFWVTFGKILLVLLTISFFCCDFLGSNYIEPYNSINFVSDLIIMAVIVYTFGSLGFHDHHKVDLKVSIFCRCFLHLCWYIWYALI